MNPPLNRMVRLYGKLVDLPKALSNAFIPMPLFQLMMLEIPAKSTKNFSTRRGIVTAARKGPQSGALPFHLPVYDSRDHDRLAVFVADPHNFRQILVVPTADRGLQVLGEVAAPFQREWLAALDSSAIAMSQTSATTRTRLHAAEE